MKIGPFKMRGFSGFKDESPAKHNENKLGNNIIRPNEIGGMNGNFSGSANPKNIFTYGGFATARGSQTGQALVTRENRKRKKGKGALDMFSGLKNFF